MEEIVEVTEFGNKYRQYFKINRRIPMYTENASTAGVKKDTNIMAHMTRLEVAIGEVDELLEQLSKFLTPVSKPAESSMFATMDEPRNLSPLGERLFTATIRMGGIIEKLKDIDRAIDL